MDNFNKKITIIVFSKDRPLQLKAYIDSLIYFSKVDLSCVNILYKYNSIISYDKLIKEYSAINWIKEIFFFGDLKKIIDQSNEFIMFGCDDIIFKDDIDLHFALNYLTVNENALGFSLRLGTNIKPVPNNLIINKMHLEWNWKKANPGHWNYPWELDATIYRKQDIMEIISKLEPNIIRNPNYFESEVAKHSYEYIKKDLLASFPTSKCIALTINRVQDDFTNSYDNSMNTDINQLYSLYKNGCSIDFIAIAKKKNKKIHVGSEFFIIEGKKYLFKKLTFSIKTFVAKISTLFTVTR